MPDTKMHMQDSAKSMNTTVSRNDGSRISNDGSRIHNDGSPCHNAGAPRQSAESPVYRLASLVQGTDNARRGSRIAPPETRKVTQGPDVSGSGRGSGAARSRLAIRDTRIAIQRAAFTVQGTAFGVQGAAFGVLGMRIGRKDAVNGVRSPRSRVQARASLVKPCASRNSNSVYAYPETAFGFQGPASFGPEMHRESAVRIGPQIVQI